MRTLLVLSCLICLLVVSTQGGSDFLKSRVTKELLEKLLQAKRNEKNSNTASTGLRERIGKFLESRGVPKKKAVLQKNPVQKKEAMSKLLNLLKKKLEERQPDPGNSGQGGPNPGPNPGQNQPHNKPNRPKPQSHEVLGAEVNENLPHVGDPIVQQSQKEAEVIPFEEPIHVMEGGDIVSLEDYEELHQYIALEMMGSKHFCARPVDQDVVDSLSEDLEDLGNNIIKTMRDTVAELRAAEQTEDAIVGVIENTFFGGFEGFKDDEEETLRDTFVMLYRYIIYGTEENTHCEIGDSYYNITGDSCTQVENSYDRLTCIEEGLYFFQYFTADPFHPDLSDITEEEMEEFEEQRCNNASTYFWYNLFTGGDINLGEFVDAIIVDFECIAEKLEEAIDDEESVERNLKRRDLECTELAEDAITESIEALIGIVTEITIDISDVVFTLLVAQPDDDADAEIMEKRSLVKLLYHMARRHYK